MSGSRWSGARAPLPHPETPRHAGPGLGAPHLDQRCRFTGDDHGSCGNRRYGMTVVQRFAARHDVLRKVYEVARRGAFRGIRGGHFREVSGRHHRLYTRQRLSFARVDGYDAGVRVGATHHRRVEHVRQVVVSAKCRPTGNLIDAIRPNRPFANPAKIGVSLRHGFCNLNLVKQRLRSCAGTSPHATGLHEASQFRWKTERNDSNRPKNSADRPG